jgi:hypothetical protein
MHFPNAGLIKHDSLNRGTYPLDNAFIGGNENYENKFNSTISNMIYSDNKRQLKNIPSNSSINSIFDGSFNRMQNYPQQIAQGDTPVLNAQAPQYPLRVPAQNYDTEKFSCYSPLENVGAVKRFYKANYEIVICIIFYVLCIVCWQLMSLRKELLLTIRAMKNNNIAELPV